MKCQNCGSESSGNAKFCLECGNNLIDSQVNNLNVKDKIELMKTLILKVIIMMGMI